MLNGFSIHLDKMWYLVALFGRPLGTITHGVKSPGELFHQWTLILIGIRKLSTNSEERWKNIIWKYRGRICSDSKLETFTPLTKAVITTLCFYIQRYIMSWDVMTCRYSWLCPISAVLYLNSVCLGWLLSHTFRKAFIQILLPSILTKGEGFNKRLHLFCFSKYSY